MDKNYQDWNFLLKDYTSFNKKIQENRKYHEKQNKWDNRFIGLAKHISTWSLDPSTQVGAVIVDRDKRIVSVGYNGLPQGVKDSSERLQNRDVKIKCICHAEINAILFAQRDLTNCILYTYPLGCCSNCSSYVIQSKISTVVFPKTENPRWIESIELSKELFKEAGIEIRELTDFPNA